MKRAFILIGIVLVTAIALVIHSEATRTGDATRILGMPVVGDDMTNPAWIAIGGKGVLVLGAGVGIVMIGWVGIGVLFAAGQACAGAIAIGQLAVGPVFFLAQLGAGIAGIGQVAIGGWVRGQGEVGKNGEALFKALDEDLDDVLRLRA